MRNPLTTSLSGINKSFGLSKKENSPLCRKIFIKRFHCEWIRTRCWKLIITQEEESLWSKAGKDGNQATKFQGRKIKPRGQIPRKVMLSNPNQKEGESKKA